MSRRHRRHQRNQEVVAMWSDIGQRWMKLGLSIGKVALETSVDTLQTTAEMLDRASRTALANREGKPDRNAEGGSEGLAGRAPRGITPRQPELGGKS